MFDKCVPWRQLSSCSVTRPLLSLRRVWLARLECAGWSLGMGLKVYCPEFGYGTRVCWLEFGYGTRNVHECILLCQDFIKINFFLGGDEEVFKNCQAWSTLWLFGGCGSLHFTLISEHQASVKLEYSWSYYVTSIDKFVVKQLGMQYPTYDVIIESISLERKLDCLGGNSMCIHLAFVCGSCLI